MLLPGTTGDMTVHLIAPVPLRTGAHFVIRRNGKTAAAGIVTQTIE